MSNPVTQPKKARKRGVRRSSFVKRYLRALRFYLVTGLLVWIPLIVTIWLTWWLYTKVGLGLENVIKSAYDWANDIGARYSQLRFLGHLQYRTGIGFLIAIGLFLSTGFVTRYLVGRRIIDAGERLLERIPLVSLVYRFVQQIRDVFVRREGTVFQSVCLVEYPRKGIYAVAFITSREQGIVHDALEKELHSVFLPTTPNPTSGFLLYLHPEDITALDISVEDGMKLIISGGAYHPGTATLERLKQNGAETDSAVAAPTFSE